MTHIINDFQKAIDRLSEVLELKETEVIRDSAIKRFEICFDLAWKAIKEYAKIQGVDCFSPRECFKTAFQLKLIEYREGWLQMMDDRNKTVHLYAALFAEEVYVRLPKYLELLYSLLTQLEIKTKIEFKQFDITC